MCFLRGFRGLNFIIKLMVCFREAILWNEIDFNDESSSLFLFYFSGFLSKGRAPGKKNEGKHREKTLTNITINLELIQTRGIRLFN